MDDILFGTPLGRPWPDVLLLSIRKYAQFALPHAPLISISRASLQAAICAKAKEADAPMTESK
jgi:hypothetical protein